MVYVEKIGTFMKPAPREPEPLGCEPSPPGVVGAKGMMSDKVLDAAGESVGRVEEFMVDWHQGRIMYAVVSTGGFMGMGDKLFAVPWEALTIDTCDNRLVLNVTKDKLDNAPSFHKDFWPDMGREEFRSQMLAYYCPEGAGCKGR